MATVKLTQSLRSDITSAITKSYERRERDAHSALVSAVSADEIYDTYVAATGGKELLDKCAHWLGTTSQITVSTINTVRTASYYAYFENDGRRPSIRIPSELSGPEYNGIAEKLYEAREKYDSIISKKREAENSIRSVLEAYSTVNAMIKDNPAVEALLPNWVKEKLAEKVVRSAVDKKAAVTIDASIIQQAVVINKLAGGV